MNPITFTVTGHPKPQPRPRAFARNMGGGKFAARVYDAGTAEGWKSLIAAAAKPHLPPEPLRVPVGIRIGFSMPRPKNHFTASGALRPSAPLSPTNKNDLDNLTKAVCDTLTQIGMWQDDGQIIEMTLCKGYSINTTGGCKITIFIP